MLHSCINQAWFRTIFLTWGLYNSSGRGFPDISAQGANIPVIVIGKMPIAECTASSTAIVAFIVALINDKLVAAGKPPVGFLNPLRGIFSFSDYKWK